MFSAQCCHWFCMFNPQREEVVWDLSECGHTCGTCEGNLQALIKMDWSHIENSTARGAIHSVPRLYVDVPMYHWWANILQHLGRSNSQHWDIVAISNISTYINWCRILSMNNRTRVEYRFSLLCLATSSVIDLELPILRKKDANMEPTEKRHIFVSVCFFAEKTFNNQEKSPVSSYVSFSIVMCQQHVQYMMHPYMYVHIYSYKLYDVKCVYLISVFMHHFSFVIFTLYLYLSTNNMQVMHMSCRFSKLMFYRCRTWYLTAPSSSQAFLTNWWMWVWQLCGIFSGQNKSYAFDNWMLEMFGVIFGWVSYTPEIQHGTWKWWFSIGISFSKVPFSGSMFVLGGVIVNWWFGLVVWDSRATPK